MGSIIGRLGVIGAIVLGGLIFRDFLPGAAIDLKVGDCFDAPTYVGEVEEVSHHPCTDLHDAEVVYVGDYEPAGAWPGEDALDAFTDTRCIAAFNDYTGLDFETALEYDMGVFYPTEEGWGRGDHEITCYVVLADETQMTSSVRRP